MFIFEIFVGLRFCGVVLDTLKYFFHVNSPLIVSFREYRTPVHQQ